MNHATVIRIASTDTHDLRRRVLREGRRDVDVAWPDDDARDTEHLGVEDDGTVVAISTWLRRPFPSTGEPGVQLRGMATDPAFAGFGLGSALLHAGLDASRQRGATVVWANARVTALDFYQRAGFEVVGPVFTTEETGLPHRCIRFDLGTLSPPSR